jgi:isopentenyldiphosphate isomerase|tara:strand:- start:31 stop:561 length:531 start_codon:yes stop_codon:yes gene_type:complete
MKKAHNPDEIIAFVDREDKVIGKITRKEAHSKGLLHRESNNYLINSKKQILLQRRTDNNLWSHSSAGHMSLKQNYLDGAVSEFKEELGIKLNKKEFKEIAKEKVSMTSGKGHNIRFIKIFLIKKDIPLNKFKIQKSELNKVRYFNRDELKKLLLDNKKIAKSARYFIKKYILKYLS